VLEFNPKNVDRAIAEKAVQRLRHEYDKGHILMARVDNVQRAKQIFELYREHGDLHPIQLHSGIKSIRAREAARQSLLKKESRIVVCVDMLVRDLICRN
jgi:hypothetical protein